MKKTRTWFSDQVLALSEFTLLLFPQSLFLSKPAHRNTGSRSRANSPDAAGAEPRFWDMS
jgi:hypothetical protein